MADGWYYGVGGQRTGPVSLAELQQLVRTGQLGPAVLVWVDGMPQWVRAGSLPVLFPQGGIDSAGLGLIVPVGNISGSAIAAGYLGLLGLVIFPLGPVAILLGVLGLRDVRRHPEKSGTGRAITGLVAGGLTTLLWGAIFLAGVLHR